MADRFPFPADRYLLVGIVSKAHGLKGEMRINPLPGQAIQLTKYSRAALVAVDGRMTAELELIQARVKGRQVILKLDTIDTKSEADLTVGMGVLAPLEEIRDHASGLVPTLVHGREVRRFDTGELIGTVEDTFNNGAQDILVVRDDRTEYLIPVVDQVVREIRENEIIVDPPPGLLELGSGPDE